MSTRCLVTRLPSPQAPSRLRFATDSPVFTISFTQNCFFSRQSNSTTTTQKRSFRILAPFRDGSKQKNFDQDKSGNPSFGTGSLSFESLGITGWTKYTVIGVISVLSTMETIFYVKMAWRWWYGDQEPQEVKDV
jgi:hypothetical protein